MRFLLPLSLSLALLSGCVFVIGKGNTTNPIIKDNVSRNDVDASRRSAPPPADVPADNEPANDEPTNPTDEPATK